MKKLILILIITTIGCSQQNDLPEPLTTQSNQTTQVSEFYGNWNCYDWIVDEITGTTHHRKIMFSSSLQGDFISLNDYSNSGVMTQLISNSGVNIDSTYFDNTISPNGIKVKGVLTSDSTLMVYQYHIVGNSTDTSQVKEFIKE
jgi:hypothetical protein